MQLGSGFKILSVVYCLIYLVHSLVFSSLDISEMFVEEKTRSYTRQWSVVFSSDLGLIFVSGLCPLASSNPAGLHQ